MVNVIVWEIDEFGNKNLYTVKEFESIFIAEEYIRDTNKNDRLLAEIQT